MGLDAMISVFWVLSSKPTFSLSSFTFIKRLFSSSLFAIRVVSSAYLRLLIFLLAILIPAYVSSSLVFCMMYAAYKLNKQGDNIQPSIQFSSVAQLCPTLCDPMNRSTPGHPVHINSQSSLRFMSIESVMPSSHLILCRPLLLLPPIPPSIKVFSNESIHRDEDQINGSRG